jgi:predicted amidohydrolase YtcJ
VRTFFRNATCWSAGKKNFDGILVEDGIIIATGVQAHTMHFDETIDLEGSFVIPAFLDGHAHPIFGGREAAGPQINGLTSLDEILAEVKKYADDNPDQPWIIGGAYEASIIESGDFDAHWLDSVVRDRPVVLHAVDHHTIWVNSEALKRSGINELTADPIGGTIARRPDGAPKGVFREPNAMALVLDTAPADSTESDVQAIKRACDAYLRVGVTAAIDSWVEKDMASAYLAAAKSGDLTIAMNLSLLASPDSWRSKVKEFVALREEFAALPDPDLVKANSIKFLADGALSAGTAALMEPYIDNQDSCGIKIWSDDELLEAVTHFDMLKFQLHIHAIGDAAVKQALDVIEAMMQINPKWDRRPVIVHAQLIADEDLPRFKKLGVIANIQPLWCYLDPMNKESILPRIGKVRNDLQFRLRTMVENGVTIAFGSDWPVTSQIPLRALAVPVNRLGPGSQGENGWNIFESITIKDSLTFYTENVAYQMFREQERGALEIGKKADFIVLDKNLLEIDSWQISTVGIKVLYKNGWPVGNSS